mmetsp:Transcript_61809/g.127800  ORF Transcript_61809/g.127800 Transcript_61809/m.127800 type:complete len:101 (-) Transcript_61809:693-995(-)
MILQLPQDWWRDPLTGKPTACTVMATSCTKLKGYCYLDCQVVKPDKARRQGHVVQLPISKCKGLYPWNLRRLLQLSHNNPRTLGDRTLTPEDGLDDITLL